MRFAAMARATANEMVTVFDPTAPSRLSRVAMEAKARGLPDLCFAITSHPLGGLKPDEVRAKAPSLLGPVVQAMSGAA